MSEFKIEPLASPQASTWKITLDGIEHRPCILQVEHAEWGKLAFGKRPEGFHGWAYWPAKNGTVTIPWCRTPSGEILIGLILEWRAVMGPEKIFGPLGGAVDLGESVAEAQRRESLEEGGLESTRAVALPGLPVNTDRTCFVQDPNKGQGLYFYGLEVPFSDLEEIADDLWQPLKDTVASKRESELRFLPWKKAIELSADGVALAGIARLLREIF